ncbi:hypothetical protein VTJ83DRAFT_167 [Remersonia thermophila]|uniref:Cytochrome P450 n=1 Tax=Remersonia thermophila TaxID=72144 RepID=A0ABR4DK92_9PEZI
MVFEPLSWRLGLAGLVVLGLALLLRKLYPKPYPGIPYNEASAKRLTGDVMEIVPIMKETNELSAAIFAVTTRKLGVPIAQFLFPGVRKPLIVLEDPREIEDILVRRHKEFDKAAIDVEVFGAMFPRATLAQYTTPELRAQKRLWADAMSVDFLRRVAAPNIYKCTLELLELWGLRAAQADRPINVLDDFKNATLDVIWIAMLGEEAGTIRFDIERLKRQLEGDGTALQPPSGAFLKEQVAYICETIVRNFSTLHPNLAQKIETYLPRYRRFRSSVTREMTRCMKKAVERYQHLTEGALESDALDTCAMDLVLRRQILQAKKAGVEPSDPTQDSNMLDEMFVLLVAGHDSTANTLAWFARFMERFPAVQSTLRAELRKAFPGPGLPSVDEILNAADVPYLDGACEEAFRLAGTAKANIRQTLVDTTILGYPVPKGAEIFLNYHIDRTPTPLEEEKRSETSRAAAERHGDGLSGIAGRDLASFNPRRWIVLDKTGKEKFDAYALPSLAMGGGFRGCFGRRMAQMELRIMVVLLILTFEFLELPEEHQSMAAIEGVFREPKHPYARLRILRE